MDEPALEDPLADRAEGLVHVPVAEGRSRHDAVLRVPDLDGLVAPGPVSVVPELALETQNLLLV